MFRVGYALCLLSLAITGAYLRWNLPDWVAGLGGLVGGPGFMFGMLGWDARWYSDDD